MMCEEIGNFSDVFIASRSMHNALCSTPDNALMLDYRIYRRTHWIFLYAFPQTEWVHLENGVVLVSRCQFSGRTYC